MSGFLIMVIVSLLLAPLIKVLGRAGRAATPPPPNPWDEMEWETQEQEPEIDYATEELAYQPMDIAPTQEGERSTELSADEPMQGAGAVAVQAFDLRTAVVADAVLNAKYRGEL